MGERVECMRCKKRIDKESAYRFNNGYKQSVYMCEACRYKTDREVRMSRSSRFMKARRSSI